MIGELRVSGMGAVPADTTANRLFTRWEPPTDRVPVAAGGDDQPVAAASMVALLRHGFQVVLAPVPVLPSVAFNLIWDGAPLFKQTQAIPSGPPDRSWDVAFYTSGSTGRPKLFGFSLDQLAIVVAWYQDIYRVTSDSVIVTAMPASYNFTFVAGICVAATIGARLHLVADSGAVLREAEALCAQHDRCIVLANPVMLQDVRQDRRLPPNALIDSGGAPLSRDSITRFRETVADLREGYGLTETASLTHFDAEGDARSLGTVGRALPGCRAVADDIAGKPRLTLHSPVIGREVLDTGMLGPARSAITTNDLGRVDTAGRLRLVGRHDDFTVGGFWPRDVLDAVGHLLGTRCALVRHPSPDEIALRLFGHIPDDLALTLRRTISELTGLRPESVSIDSAHRLLHSRKIPRRVPAGEVTP